MNDTHRVLLARIVLVAGTLGSLVLAQDSRPAAPPRPADVPEMAWTIRILNGDGSPDAPKLARLHVDDADARVRGQALMTLADMGNATDVPAFLAHATDPDTYVRRRAFDGLVQHGPKADGAAAAALAALKDADGWVVQQAVLILEAQDKVGRGVEDPISRGVTDSIADIQPFAAEPALDILVRRGSAGPAIVAALRNGVHRKTQLAALKCAVESKDPILARKLRPFAEGRDLELAQAAVKAVTSIEGMHALDWLVKRLEVESRPKVLDEVLVGLRGLTGRMYGTDLAAWKHYLAESERATAKK